MWYTCKLPSANTETSLLLLLLFLLLSSSSSTVTYDYKWKLWPTRIEFIICWMHCNGSPYACFANVRMKYAVLNGVILFIFIIIIVRSHCLSLSISCFSLHQSVIMLVQLVPFSISLNGYIVSFVCERCTNAKRRLVYFCPFQMNLLFT